MRKVSRFAPSPTGPLHFGSLVCAFISYVIAKQDGADWLVRIEDLDEQRCKSEYVNSILTTLESHHLLWDGEIIYQSKRSNLYLEYINALREDNLLYGCSCSRKEIKLRSSFYDGFCRNKHLPLYGNIVRLKNDDCATNFYDQHLGHAKVDSYLTLEDPVLRRADGQFTYNLAVIVDDIEQSITQIARGSDLFELTPLHIELFQHFNYKSPEFFHLPLAVHQLGTKYSKQAYSPPISNKNVMDNLKSCVSFMGGKPDEMSEFNNVDELIEWTISNWNRQMLPKVREIIVSQTNGLYFAQ
ncbi:tRNA glutamyl-Q(34) synthetase GluQRS [Glaciecola sp. 1036]|uniref:tRNA glutamyl-Q(34) synthetase GluQRS n=1 Tax=Alteromonadaceae TaxID=72275 RepID=UPI003CFC7D3F